MGISKTDRITNCSTYPFFSDPPGRLSRSLSLSHATSYRPVDLSEYTHEASVCGLSPQLCASTGHFVPWRRAGFSVTSHVFTVFPVYSLGWICTEEREVIHSRWEMELKVWSERDKKETQTTSQKSIGMFLLSLFVCFFKTGVSMKRNVNLCRDQTGPDMKEEVQRHFPRFLNLWIKARLVSDADHNEEYCSVPFPLGGKFLV